MRRLWIYTAFSSLGWCIIDGEDANRIFIIMEKPRTVLSTEQIREIRLLFQVGFPKRVIGQVAVRLYGTHHTTPYRHLNADPTLYRQEPYEVRRNRKNMVEQVMALYNQGELTSQQIAEELGIPLRKTNAIIVANLQPTYGNLDLAYS